MAGAAVGGGDRGRIGLNPRETSSDLPS